MFFRIFCFVLRNITDPAIKKAFLRYFRFKNSNPDTQNKNEIVLIQKDSLLRFLQKTNLIDAKGFIKLKQLQKI